MNVRTVSQLNETLEISNEDLFQISKYISTNSYNSQKITYKNIMNDMNSKIDHKLNVEYNFYNDTIDNHKKEIKDNRNNIETLDTEVNKINQNINKLEENIPLWDMKHNITDFVSPNLDGKIINTSKDNLYIFNFNKDNKVKYTNSLQISKTGNFFCYGWITAPKVIDPADAWVGIEAKNENGDWILISLQPWIVGNNSNIMQYVGFNCPIQQDMEVRITTGFTITDFSRSFSGRGLVLNVESNKIHSNINNCFIGYILG